MNTSIQREHYDMTAIQREHFRLNRTVRLNVNSVGASSLDGALETYNADDKKMQQSRSNEAHITKSLYISLLRRCHKFMQQHYGEKPVSDSKRSTAPRKTEERCVLYLLFETAELLTPKGRVDSEIDKVLWDHADASKQKATASEQRQTDGSTEAPSARVFSTESFVAQADMDWEMTMFDDEREDEGGDAEEVDGAEEIEAKLAANRSQR